jgi:dTDP-4-dehydrorhamnose reductase
MTNVDRCQEQPDLAMKVNGEGTETLARVCREIGARLVYFSTDYVFDGGAGPYGEEDPPRPLSHYAESKLQAERCIAESKVDAVIVRTANIFSYLPGDSNFFMQMWNSFAAGRPFACYTDQSGTPTYAPALAQAALSLAHSTFRGLIHIAGPDWVARSEWGELTIEAFQWDRALLQKVMVAERPQRAPRPAKAGLRCERAGSLGIRIPPVKMALEEIRRRFHETQTTA